VTQIVEPIPPLLETQPSNRQRNLSCDKQNEVTAPTNKTRQTRERGDKGGGALLVVLSDEMTDQPSCFLPFRNDAFAFSVNPNEKYESICSGRKGKTDRFASNSKVATTFISLSVTHPRRGFVHFCDRNNVLPINLNHFTVPNSLTSKASCLVPA
jgi:hypothetical protein